MAGHHSLLPEEERGKDVPQASQPGRARQAAAGAPGYHEGSTICGVLVAVAQADGGSSVPNLLCAKDQANENCEHRSGI